MPCKLCKPLACRSIGKIQSTHHYEEDILRQDHLCTREICYKFYRVAQGKDSNTSFVHNTQACQFESHKKSMRCVKISMKKLAKLCMEF